MPCMQSMLCDLRLCYVTYSTRPVRGTTRLRLQTSSTGQLTIGEELLGYHNNNNNFAIIILYLPYRACCMRAWINDNNRDKNNHIINTGHTSDTFVLTCRKLNGSARDE